MADTDLTGHAVLATVSHHGVEQDDLKVPMQHLRDAGARLDVAAAERSTIQTLVGDKGPGEPFEPTTTLADADPSAYDLLLIPGGTINADTLRRQERAVAIARSFIEAGKPIAAICHGPWTLVETGALTGKHLTSYPSLQTDVRNAGGEWSDESVVVDESGWTLVTSRNPKDLPDFTGAIDRVLTSVPA
ncbi:type 1 glutamine amidotransferase domain-containing protein [Amnibacterium sp.]|uniref:type 1 glutamine amidotransferase domain-containing protein n=1 Tax=Amnibacterium sp. TaxID=1872496 RepID=UPI00262D09F8|nr:type 1 glutamine amidotransferase domain-containing protein [Amnibacterium sp.]MCU1473173.1 type 1 glutamine amidotransferase [Amnibacterium sp.]